MSGPGFRHHGRTEVVFVSTVMDLPRPGAVAQADVTPRRTVGTNGTRISAVRGMTVLGYIEVDTNLDSASRMSRLNGWADIGNLYVDEACRRKGVGTWLVGQAAEWLDLGGVARLLDYAVADDDGYQGYEAFLKKTGFRVLTRTLRGLMRS